MYFGLVVLLIRPLLLFPVRYPLLVSLMLCVLLGALMEILQARLDVSRSGSWSDGLANLGGALLGITFYLMVLKDTRLEKWI